jgi:hypothetical protein
MALSGVEFLIAMDRADNPSMRIPAKKGTEKFKRIMEFSDTVIRERRQKQLNEDFLYMMELGRADEAEKLFWKGADVNAKQDDDMAWGAKAWASDNKEADAMLNRITRLQNLRFLGKSTALHIYRSFRKCLAA